MKSFNKYKKGVFLGRFQPLHKGHLAVLRKMLKDCDRVVIVIGSSQHSRKNTNPLSLRERKDILEEVIDYAGLPKERIAIISMKDTSNNDEWIKNLEQKIKFDVIYTGNPLVQVLAVKQSLKKRKQYDIVDIGKLKKKISATRIRELISINDERWKRMVPYPVIRYLLEKNLLSEFKERH